MFDLETVLIDSLIANVLLVGALTLAMINGRCHRRRGDLYESLFICHKESAVDKPELDIRTFPRDGE